MSSMHRQMTRCDQPVERTGSASKRVDCLGYRVPVDIESEWLESDGTYERPAEVIATRLGW